MKPRRLILWSVLLLVGAGLIAPFLNANHFRERIKGALESALNRPVKLGRVHFNLFTGPGFTVEDVLIAEDPGHGIEPFAHVRSLEARVRLTSLWTGQLSFSNLKLIEPSVNFVKIGSGPWNIQPLLNRAVSLPTSAASSLPDIQIRDGRLDFKLDNTKSVFYIANADLDLYANDQGNLIIGFSGEPSRTDHAAQGVVPVVARGVLKPSRNAEDQIEMSVQLERTSIPEIARLFDIHDLGIRGSVVSNLKLAGPLSNIKISGDLRIEGVHRWDLMPNKSEIWTLNYNGFLNVPGQQVEIATRAADEQGSPVNMRFSASNYQTAPKWNVSLTLHDMPIAGLEETARHMGAPLPPGASIDAKLNGDVTYSQPDGVKGRIILDSAAFKLPQGATFQFASAPVELSGDMVKFGPASIVLDDDQSAQLEGEYSVARHTLRLALEAKVLGIAQTKAFVQKLLGAGAVPLLDHCRQGSWKGKLIYDQSELAADWSGEFDLQNTQIDVAGMLVPLRIASAVVQLQPAQVQINKMHARVGTIAFEGDYRYVREGLRPDRMRINLPELQLKEVERIFSPTLARQQGFFARALRLERAHVPEWLEKREIEGMVQAKNVLAGDVELGAVRGRLLWSGAKIQITGLESKLDEMEGSGRLVMDLSASVPQYSLSGDVRGIDYHGGTLDLSGAVSSSGTGADVIFNARSEGTFTGSRIEFGADTEFDEVVGDYRIDPGGRGARLSLPRVQLTQGQEVLHGQGTSQGDGRIVLEVTSGRKQLRLTGVLLPLRGVGSP
jgi:hypothetical protein